MKMLEIDTEFGMAYVPKARLVAIVPQADEETGEPTGRWIVFVENDITLLAETLPVAAGGEN